MYESRTSLVYTFRLEEIFEFLSKSVHEMNMGHTVFMKTNTSHGTYMGCRLSVVCQ